MPIKTIDEDKGIDVYVNFVGLNVKGESEKEVVLTVEPILEDALKTVKNYVEEITRRSNYMVYHNGKFISRHGVRGSNSAVREGDVFKIIPVMSGG